MEPGYLAGIALFALTIAALGYFAFVRKKGRDKASLRERIFLPREVSVRKGKATAPISGRCETCGETVSLPFRCKFCSKIHCERHRIPENHECEGLARFRRDKSATI